MKKELAIAAVAGAALGCIVGYLLGEVQLYAALGLFVGLGLAYDIGFHASKKDDSTEEDTV